MPVGGGNKMINSNNQNAIPEDFLRRDLRVDKAREAGDVYRVLSLLYAFGGNKELLDRYQRGDFDRT